ncbi:MAG: hypothetical protein ACREAZ_02165 [Nitrososphaera sp.]
MDQVSNVLIILIITALMAIVTTVLAYFVDFITVAIDGGSLGAASSALEAIILTFTGN